ncbi:hypothetical protein BP6252_07788 [Coleophoma cylindrospora]|uniref:Uncharacterized protein n=1 Tax=Coleophoma cylindrospora TaxID=1849047 RepID=A0A3D8RB34_9HELO|nr:hypothetical protein BP6252_07788 [Coleophoma cylindrospora]
MYLLNIFSLASLLLATSVLALPTQSHSRNPTTHACSVFIQRWSDNSFDIYDYNYAPTPSSSQAWNYIMSVESISLVAGESLPPTTLGSNTLTIINLANPISNTDPGRLSFAWGTQTWSNLAGNLCTNTPRGNGAGSGAYPTNTSCNFQCDA